MTTIFLTLELQDLYVAGGLLVGFATGLVAVIIAFVTVKKYIFKPIHITFIKPILVKRALKNDLVGIVAELKKQTDLISAEVTTNGGSSLKDAVNRIENDIVYTRFKLAYQEEIAKDALFEIDARGNLIRANRSLCELVNVSEGDLVNKNWIVRIVPAEQQRVIGEWKQAIENRCPVDSYQTIIIGTFVQGTSLNNRNLINVRVQAIPFMDKKNELNGFFGWMVKVEND